MHQVRAVVLTNYLEVAETLGLDGALLLREAGFASASLADPDNRLPATAVVSLLERSAERSSYDSFGLLLAERLNLADIGAVSLLLEHLPNLHEVVLASIAYRHHLSDVATMALEESEGTALIKVEVSPVFWSVQTCDLLLGIAHRGLAGASHGIWKPAEVHVVREAPSDLGAWRRLFGARMVFGSSFNGFVCSSAALRAPIPLADTAMARNAARLLKLMPGRSGPRPLADRVRHAIAQLLPQGRTTLRDIAAHMGMSQRSLQRRLEDENASFGALLSGVRQEMAAAYLGSSGQPLTTIAGLLGYSSSSSFTRWFTATFGTTPQAWRAAHTAAAD